MVSPDPTTQGAETKLVALSLGAGVQSTVLALMACDGTLPMPDVAIFADTGWEPAHVYAHLARLTEHCAAHGLEVIKVSNGNLRAAAAAAAHSHRYASIPYYIRNPDGGDGMGRRQCTSEYKLAPIMREIRKRLGATAPKYRSVPRGNFCEQWIGFTIDEVQRIGGKYPKYTRATYPLIDLRMTRQDCIAWLTERGWSAEKSACIGCPYHGNSEWRALKAERPDEWADAVEMDRLIRKGGSRGAPLRGEAFLHRQRVPLDLVDLRTPAQRDRDAGQGSLWDEAEDGDPDGCSPFGCRSGLPVGAS